ncbi:MAG: hypothetical protein IIC81_06480 [Chloroflexi bacterium]|nr:hypothetical protein [Chloroflexota bacterium]
MLKYLAILTALVTVAPLPPKIGYFIGRVVADLLFMFDKPSRQGASDNVRRALGPSPSEALVNHTTLEVFRNSAKNGYDLVTLARLDPSSVEKRLTVHGWHHFDQAIQRGKGVVLVSIHMGIMDMSVQVIKARSVKLTILAEVTEPREIYNLNVRLRESHGISLLPVTYSGLKEAIRRLKRGEVVAIAIDRAIQDSGMMIDFFGEETLLPVGGVKLAYLTGAAIAPAFTVRQKGDRYSFFFEPPIYLAKKGDRDYNIRQALTKLVGYMETYIRRYPDQWMVFQPIWKGSGLSPGRAASTGNGRGQITEWGPQSSTRSKGAKSGDRHTTSPAAR